MGAKEYLEQVRNMSKRVDSKLRERERMLSRVEGVELTDELELKLRKYDEEVNDYVDELLGLQVKIADEIMQLDKYTHQMVLRERYLHNKKWEEIADEQHYDISYLHKLHRQALGELEKGLTDK